MHVPYSLALPTAVLVFLLSGCTPLSERIAQRSLNSGASTEIHRQQSVSLARYERQLSTRVDPSTFTILQQYGELIHACADRYGFDWRLILAVMKTESAFQTSAESEKGAYGLMQIMPLTGAEIERTLDLLDIRDPSNNIHGGVYYLRQLYNLFLSVPSADRLQFALAAYNAGVGRIYDAQELTLFFRGNPSRWSSIRHALELLGSDQCELHEIVWADGRPRSGFFDNPDETLAYVDKVLGTYADYKRTLE
ncbi:MAG TPA: transglycosylase SLT domain-containing protein [Bacteroidota bacterium]